MKLDLSLDEILCTTHSVRRRLDLYHPVEPEILKECHELAIQAPSGSNNQHWHFFLVTDPCRRQALSDLYRKGFATYCALARVGQAVAMRRTAMSGRELTVCQSCWEAKRAPSALTCSFAQAMSGSTVEDPAKVANPHSVPAITRSRPTREAKRLMRCATSSGCSIKLVVESRMPGISTFSSGTLTFANTVHSCS